MADIIAGRLLHSGIHTRRNWHLSHRADKRALPLADRHYSRQKPGSPQYVQPGRCLCLLTSDADALWVTVFPYAKYVKHAWPTAWQCSLFRNEGDHLASELIWEAVAATRWHYGEPPEIGMLTFVAQDKVRPKKNPGYCYMMAGFEHVGYAKDGKMAFILPPHRMSPPVEPLPLVKLSDEVA